MFAYTNLSALSVCMKVSNKNFFGFSNLSQGWKKCSFPLSSYSLRNHRQSMLPMLEAVWSLLCECALPFGMGLISSFMFLWQISPFPAHQSTFLFTAREAALEFPGQVTSLISDCSSDCEVMYDMKKFSKRKLSCWKLLPMTWIEKCFLLSFQKCMIAWVSTSLKVLRWAHLCLTHRSLTEVSTPHSRPSLPWSSCLALHPHWCPASCSASGPWFWSSDCVILQGRNRSPAEPP